MARVFNRQEFYDLVWSKPMTHLAKEFGLSDVALHKICRKHEIPNPPLGWWAKKAAGQKVKQIPLPKAKAGISDRITIAGSDTTQEPEALTSVREQARIIASLTLEDPVSTEPIVERTIAKLAKAKPSATGLVAVDGKGIIKCEVAPDSIERLRTVLDHIVGATRFQGFNLLSGDAHAHFANDAETIAFSVSESVKREKHALTPEEQKKEEEWQRKQQRHSRSWDWRISFDRPRFPEWDYHPTGKLAIEFEQVYLWDCPSPRRSFRDAKIQRLENMAGDIGVGLAVLAAAKSEARRRREEAARQEEERRQLRELAQRAKHIEERRTGALTAILAEVAELDRLRNLIALLRIEMKSSDEDRVTAFVAWSEDHLAKTAAALAPAALQERFLSQHLFGDDDDYDFRPPMWGY